VNVSKSAIRFPPAALLFISLLFFVSPVAGQKDKPAAQPSASPLTRTTMRHGVFRLAYGGTLTISGAPAGSITIEGWQRSEVELTAEIGMQAGSAEDLDRLLTVNNFAVDEDANHMRVLTTGTHDKAYMKRVAKDFPKSLLGLPWRIDFHLKVPALIDLEIDAGNGPIKISGVEGAIRLNAFQSVADLTLTGGMVSATVQIGVINITVPVRGWHGLGADIKVANGNLNLELLPGFHADIDATILRAGEIKNTYPNLEPKDRGSIGPRSLRARAGSGGASLSFTVGDGTIQIKQSNQ